MTNARRRRFDRAMAAHQTPIPAGGSWAPESGPAATLARLCGAGAAAVVGSRNCAAMLGDASICGQASRETSATVGRTLAPGRTYALENSKALFCIIAERAAMLPGERLGLLLGSGIVRLTEKFLEHPELARQRPARREPIKLVPKLGKLW